MRVLAFVEPGALVIVAATLMFWIDAKLSDSADRKRHRYELTRMTDHPQDADP